MGILTRATRNITRRKARAIIVIVALSLALSVVVLNSTNHHCKPTSQPETS